MLDLTTGQRVPTELDCDFTLSIGDPFGDGEILIDEGTPIGVHFIEHEGMLYRVVCSVQFVRSLEPTDD